MIGQNECSIIDCLTNLCLHGRVLSLHDLIEGTPLSLHIVQVDPSGWELIALTVQDLLSCSEHLHTHTQSIETRYEQTTVTQALVHIGYGITDIHKNGCYFVQLQMYTFYFTQF